MSLLGDWITFVTVSVLSVEQGGGAEPVALIFIAHSLPGALFAPLGGVLADRLDRKWLLIGVNVIQCALTLVMVPFANASALLALQALVFVRASVTALWPPTESAALRGVLSDDELLPANAFVSGTWSVMFALGMAVGGFVATLGPTLALSIDAATFAISALLLSGLPSLPPEDRAEKKPLFQALSTIGPDMRAALHEARKDRALLTAVLAKTPIALAAGGAWVLLNLQAAEVAFAGSAAVTLGILQSTRGVGTGVGPLVFERLKRRGMSVRVGLAAAAFLTFSGIAVLGLARSAVSLLLATLLWGLGSGANWVLSTSEMQRLGPIGYTGRLAAIDWLLFTLAMCLSAYVGAVLTAYFAYVGSALWLGLGAGVLVFLVGDLWGRRGR